MFYCLEFAELYGKELQKREWRGEKEGKEELGEDTFLSSSFCLRQQILVSFKGGKS